MTPLRVLKKRSDFLAVASHRQKWVTPAFILQMGRFGTAPEASIGYGLTASKKMVGNAVQRNRAKRRMRALVREMLAQHGEAGRGYIMIARQEMLTRDFKTLCQDLENALKRLSQKYGAA